MQEINLKGVGKVECGAKFVEKDLKLKKIA